MNEVKLLAALIAGARIRQYEDRFIVTTGNPDHEDLDGDDIQQVAAKLLEKGFITNYRPRGGYLRVTDEGRAALARFDIAYEDFILSDPDNSKEIYTGTAFICRLCQNFADIDREEVEAHIAEQHSDDHSEDENNEDSEYDDGGDDQNDYAFGGIYYQPASGMDRPHNFDEPTEA